MRSFPLPVRVAAGAAVSAVECTRQLPSTVTSLPVTLVSQALQTSMRLQQHVTHLAIKGDAALSGLREPSEQPEWATFDEDAAAEGGAAEDEAAEDEAAEGAVGENTTPIPTAASEQARPIRDDRSGHGTAAGTGPTAGDTAGNGSVAPGPPCLPRYDSLSMPQLRGMLRTLSEADLVRLLRHEQEHHGRERFERMLHNRLDRMRQSDIDADNGNGHR